MSCQLTLSVVSVKPSYGSFLLGGFHIWRPQWVGEGVPKKLTKGTKSADYDSDRGGKKFQKFADIIYGSPLIQTSVTVNFSETIYCRTLGNPQVSPEGGKENSNIPCSRDATIPEKLERLRLWLRQNVEWELTPATPTPLKTRKFFGKRVDSRRLQLPESLQPYRAPMSRGSSASFRHGSSVSFLSFLGNLIYIASPPPSPLPLPRWMTLASLSTYWSTKRMPRTAK